LVAYVVYALAIVVFCFFYVLFGSLLYVLGPLVLALIPISGIGQLGKSYAINLMVWNAWGILYATFGALITAIQFNRVNDVLGNGFLGFLQGLWCWLGCLPRDEGRHPVARTSRAVRGGSRAGVAWPPPTDSIDQALWFLGSQEIDVVLLDWTLPHAGAEVLRQLKHRRPECEVVAITNNNQVQSAVEAMRAGAFDCLSKPFGLKEMKLLLDRVSEHLKQKAEKRASLRKQQIGTRFWRHYRAHT
jgi:CheY-like chemotaxis protein